LFGVVKLLAEEMEVNRTKVISGGGWSPGFAGWPLAGSLFAGTVVQTEAFKIMRASFNNIDPSPLDSCLPSFI